MIGQKYLYCGNNPINSTDPTGEFFGLLDMSMTMSICQWYENGKNYDAIADSMQGFVAMINSRNQTIADLADAYNDPSNTEGIDAAFMMWEGYEKAQKVFLAAGIMKAGASFSVGGAELMFKYATAKGHHIIPKWAGGYEKQILHNWTKQLTQADHSGILEPIIKKRMKEKLGIRVGGWGGGTKDIDELFIQNPELQGKVFDELLDIYKEYDKVYGTILAPGLRLNQALGFYKKTGNW